MKNAVLAFLFLFSLVACKKPQESIATKIKKADHVEVTFFANGSQARPLSFSDAGMLDSLSKLVSDTPMEPKGCASDGKISYKKGDSLIFEGEFSLGKECGHIAFTDGGKTGALKLDPQPMNLLTRLKAKQEASKLEKLGWFIGKWTQSEGPDLTSYEQWTRANDHLFKGRAWTLYHTDTVHSETIDLLWEGDDIFYIPTVKGNAGPVRFKLTENNGQSAVFENPEHDFPTKITYENRGDSMLYAKISGMVKGKEVAKEFPLQRAKD